MGLFGLHPIKRQSTPFYFGNGVVCTYAHFSVIVLCSVPLMSAAAKKSVVDVWECYTVLYAFPTGRYCIAVLCGCIARDILDVNVLLVQ